MWSTPHPFWLHPKQHHSCEVPTLILTSHKTTSIWSTPHFSLPPKRHHSFKIPPHSFWLPSKQPHSSEVPPPHPHTHTHSFWLLPKTTFMWGTPHSFWLKPKQRHSFKIPPPLILTSLKTQSPEVPHTHSDFPQSDTIHSKYRKPHSDFPQNNNIHWSASALIRTFQKLTLVATAGYSADTMGAWHKVFVIKLTQGTQHDVREVVQHHLVTDEDGAEVLWLRPHCCVLGTPTAQPAAIQHSAMGSSCQQQVA